MKYLIIISFSFSLTTLSKHSVAQITDTLTIAPINLNKKALKYGNLTYVVYNKKNKESPSEGIYLSKINIASKLYNGKAAITITQKWDKGDTVIHKAYTVLNPTNLSTIFHQTYWKKQGYTTTFNFETKEVSFDGFVADSVKRKVSNDFMESFGDYNLNWHSDLVVFTLLPYKVNRAFKIKLYDPGSGRASEQIYTVTASENLLTSSGEKIDCWVLEIKVPEISGYQRFWVDKKNYYIVKEKDYFNNTYRYKLKLEVSEDN